MSELDRYRLSFGGVADVYERSRPLYAAEAIAWLRGRLPLGRVLDLGAGTGKLTRQLVEAGADVVAVEPDAQMRAVLARVLPQVELLEGSAEAIPLPDGSVDVVTAAQAFHWFDAERALPEIHRVLRPGGGVALLWNEWADEPLTRRLEEIVAPLRPASSHRSSDAQHPLAGTPLFANLGIRSFPHADTVDPETLVERVASVSAVVVAPADARERALAEVRALAGDAPLRFPLVTSVGAADRA
ncbi:MAG TPA: class I SAM-dependent methyltransferase [Gaiellaceae bacterium]|nr:class I SAM-dependent methyltransferase [Gaiellaceae bacterium]